MPPITDLDLGEIELVINALDLVTKGCAGVRDKLENAKKIETKISSTPTPAKSMPPTPKPPTTTSPSILPASEISSTSTRAAPKPSTTLPTSSISSSAAAAKSPPPKGTGWTADEDQVLRDFRTSGRGKWDLMRKALPHRSTKMIKSRSQRLFGSTVTPSAPPAPPPTSSTSPTPSPPGFVGFVSAPEVSPLPPIEAPPEPLSPSSIEASPMSKPATPERDDDWNWTLTGPSRDRLMGKK